MTSTWTTGCPIASPLGQGLGASSYSFRLDRAAELIAVGASEVRWSVDHRVSADARFSRKAEAAALTLLRRSSSVAIAIGECPSAASTTRRESLGASRAGVRLSGSAADDEQSDDEDEDDELEGDA